MDDTYRPGVTQSATYTGTAGVISNAFGAGTNRVRIIANSACHFALGGSPTATTADPFLPAQWAECLTVRPGEKLSFVQASTNGLVTATAGTAWVTEIS